MRITTTVRSKIGIVNLTIEIENATLSGVAEWEGNKWSVKGYGVVQGKKVLIIEGGPAPYLLISEQLYEQIHNEAKKQYRAQMSAEQKDWERVCALEAAYKQSVDKSDSFAETIKARDAYEQALSEFATKYPNSKYLQGKKGKCNPPVSPSDTDKIWSL